jgi:HEAT repeat protein
LDEITEPHIRMMFAQELERTAARYPDAPIVVTSRIVGYRDMPFRMRAGFEHGIIAELDRDDKALFASRWIEVTEQHQTEAERAKRAHELLDALDASDRIQRLTGNPMLLTTLALVKRKVGKLPNRRNKLYAEAVAVLLNWNPRLYATIEEDEAIPQLEYLAYEMCKRGVQRLTEDDVIELLERVREEYPNIRAIRRRDSETFLRDLEARSSILIRSGGVWEPNVVQEKPVWEFRHLTFQEYLAARAVLDGRYPGRDRSLALSEQVGPLAGAVQVAPSRRSVPKEDDEREVPESWREALRLLVADCKDDDVDEVILAILSPRAEEDAAETSRPRAALAALCIADEPNVSEAVTEQVLRRLAEVVAPRDGTGHANTSVDEAAVQVASSMWAKHLRDSLISEFCNRSADARWSPGGLWGMAEVASWGRARIDPAVAVGFVADRLQATSRTDQLSAALAIMEAAFEGLVSSADGVVESLFALLARGGADADAAAWALVWLSGGFVAGLEVESSRGETSSVWAPSGEQERVLLEVLSKVSMDEANQKRCLIGILAKGDEGRGVSPFVPLIDDPDPGVRGDVIRAMAQRGAVEAVPHLLNKLDDSDDEVRMVAAQSLVSLGDRSAVERILKKLDQPEWSIRREAISTLAMFGDVSAVPALVARLDDPHRGVRISAIRALAEIRDKRAVPPLVAMLDDEEPQIRLAVIEALSAVGEVEVVPELIARVGDSDDSVRAGIVGCLTRLGDQRAVVPLARMLDDPNDEVRASVVMAMRRLNDTRAVPFLLAKLDDPILRDPIAEALGHLRDRRAVPLLLAAMRDSEDESRARIIRAVSQISDDAVLPQLLEYLDAASPIVRRATVVALGRFGDRRAVGPLLSRLNDPEVRRVAIPALAQLGDGTAVEPLLGLLKDRELRTEIIAALGDLGDNRAVPAMLAELSDPSRDVRIAVVHSVVSFQHPDVAPHLLAALVDEDEEVRLAVVNALGQIKDTRVISPLAALLRNESSRMAVAASVALYRQGDERGAPALKELLTHDSQQFRVGAVRALVEIRGNPDEGKLMSRDFDGQDPWWDPSAPIRHGRLVAASRALGVSLHEARLRYESLASDFDIRIC